jgi:hypothetical protein
VAGWPSSVQPQPNCEHQPCWVLAIDLYVSDAPLTRVPVVAQADNSAHKTIAANVPLRILFMIDHLSSVVAQGIEWTGTTCSTFRMPAELHVAQAGNVCRLAQWPRAGARQVAVRQRSTSPFCNRHSELSQTPTAPTFA